MKPHVFTNACEPAITSLPPPCGWTSSKKVKAAGPVCRRRLASDYPDAKPHLITARVPRRALGSAPALVALYRCQSTRKISLSYALEGLVYDDLVLSFGRHNTAGCLRMEDRLTIQHKIMWNPHAYVSLKAAFCSYLSF